jgi:hypothetical protein
MTTSVFMASSLVAASPDFFSRTGGRAYGVARLCVLPLALLRNRDNQLMREGATPLLV